MTRTLLFIAILEVADVAGADEQRARVNYMLHCQGCHLAEAVGHPGNVPRMRGFLGYFLHSTEGREFIVRVPGVATASLENEQLAELLNWILTTYSAEELPTDFTPFNATEIGVLRKDLETDPAARRKEILTRIAAGVPELTEALESNQY